MEKYTINTTAGNIKLTAECIEQAEEKAILLGYTLDIADNFTESDESKLTVHEIEQTLTKKGWPTKSTDNSCDICGNEPEKNHPRKAIYSFGRMVQACESCYDFEKQKVRQAEIVNFEETTITTLPAKIESIVKSKVDSSLARAQALYNEERPAWLLQNFESADDMYEQLVQFIVELEELEFVTKTRKRAAYDGIRELHGRLSKAERDKLINDPNFVAPDNKEYKRRMKGTGNPTGIHTGAKKTKEQKALDALLAMGISPEQAQAMVNSAPK